MPVAVELLVPLCRAASALCCVRIEKIVGDLLSSNDEDEDDVDEFDAVLGFLMFNAEDDEAAEVSSSSSAPSGFLCDRTGLNALR